MEDTQKPGLEHMISEDMYHTITDSEEILIQLEGNGKVNLSRFIGAIGNRQIDSFSSVSVIQTLNHLARTNSISLGYDAIIGKYVEITEKGLAQIAPYIKTIIG